MCPWQGRNGEIGSDNPSSPAGWKPGQGKLVKGTQWFHGGTHVAHALYILLLRNLLSSDGMEIAYNQVAHEDVCREKHSTSTMKKVAISGYRSFHHDVSCCRVGPSWPPVPWWMLPQML
jgi:hypothetical protein